MGRWPTRHLVDGPTLPDGSLDVRAWCRLLDGWCNEGIYE